MKKNHQTLLTVLLTLVATFALAPSPSAQTSTASSSCPEFSEGTLCSSEQPYCGDDCTNTPFCPTTCWTSQTGPAWSGAGTSSATYQLYCASATYANCHYSGPPWATGASPENIPLPCMLNADGTMADCKCKVFTGPNYVNMTAIMNLGVYYETVAVCGSDGSNCQNLSNCPPDGSGDCAGEVPPVCQYISGQNPDDSTTSLIPGADLISTYGLDMEDTYPLGQNQTTCENILAAGCMTAPCQYVENSAGESDTSYAQCACPTWFQRSFTLSQSNQGCNLGEEFVWE